MLIYIQDACVCLKLPRNMIYLLNHCAISAHVNYSLKLSFSLEVNLDHALPVLSMLSLSPLVPKKKEMICMINCTKIIHYEKQGRWLNLPMYIYIYIYIYIRIYMCVCVCACVRVYVCMYVCRDTYTCIISVSFPCN